MDPLSALSLAGTIAQFVQFATGLFQGTRKIYESVSGSTEKSDSLDYIHMTLSDLLTKLNASAQQTDSRVRIVASGLPKDAPSLSVLASMCRQDCFKILGIIQKMKAEAHSGPKIWKSFRAALAESTKAHDVEQLHQRITSYQRLMVLHLCSVSNSMIEGIDTQVRSLRFDLHALRSGRSHDLASMAQSIKAIQSKISAIRLDHEKKEFSADEIDSLTEEVSGLCLRSQQVAKEFEFLSSLDYPYRSVRYEGIVNAHERTFNWVFSGSESPNEELGSLVNWLRDGTGTYWISGRPGSGKSTLMKFLAKNSHTENMLAQWGDPKTCFKAFHFFWSAGTQMQRSQEGLLRSLIYDILSQNFDLIRKVAAEKSLRMGHNPPVPTNWLLSDLHAIIQLITGQSQLNARFCFFIDGLDEYGGDHAQLCDTLLSLSRSPNIKLVLASRPWNVFEDSFGKIESQRLYLHRLTSKDIRDYTESRLFGHPNWNLLVSEAGEEHATALVQEITTRSRGVFLWVFLVTRLLREGLTNLDTLGDLRRRLDAIPTDLENFFKVMLESVDPFYHQKMAGALHLALSANEPLQAWVYCFHELEYEDPIYAISEEVEAWDVEKYCALEAPLPRRLNSRCQGLLEVHAGRVEFLHRTVRDFLHTAEMRDFIKSKEAPGFESAFSIFQAYVAGIKHSSFYGSSTKGCKNSSAGGIQQEHLLPVLHEALSYSGECSPSKDRLCFELLDDLEWSIESMFDEDDPAVHTRPIALCRALVLRNGFARYIGARLDNDGTFLHNLPSTPLAILLLGLGGSVESVFNEHIRSERRRQMLCDLLRRGYDPNEHISPHPWYKISKGMTAWSGFLSRHVTINGQQLFPSTGLLTALEDGSILLLLDSGADANATLDITKDKVIDYVRLPAWVAFLSFAFSSSIPHQNTDSYLVVLHQLLAVADFEAPGDDYKFLSSDPGCSHSTVCSREKPRNLRVAMLEYIKLYLDRGSSQRSPGRMKTKSTELRLLSKAIGIFMTHAAQNGMALDKLKSLIGSFFPSSLNKPLLSQLDGICLRTTSDRQSAKRQSKDNEMEELPRAKKLYKRSIAQERSQSVCE